MKSPFMVVHLSYSDVHGGAAIAASRHCEAMIRAGIDSKLVILEKSGSNSYAETPFIGLNKLKIALNKKISIKESSFVNSSGTFSGFSRGFDFAGIETVREADLIVLHWINGDMLSVRGVEKILELGKPTVWYLHDMFPITGGCHYSFDCNGYTGDCSNCPVVHGKYCSKLPFRILSSKIRHLRKYDNLVFAGPSRWITGCASSSSLASGHKCVCFPNVLDTDKFKPLPFPTKSLFGLDEGKKTIMFGATAVISSYKGAEYIRALLECLDPSKYECLIVGHIDGDYFKSNNITIRQTGFLRDDISLVAAYNACDTILVPSLADNYPNMILEAMACGKPCVGFNTGGIPDLVRHGESGYLCSEKSTESLKQGLEYIFDSEERYEELSESARRQMVANNSYSRNLTEIFNQ